MLGHVFRMDHQRIPQQALYWQAPGYKRGPGRPQPNWRSTVNKDLQKMGFTWEEAEVAALHRHKWRRSVAQCIQLDAGWIKVKVTQNEVSKVKQTHLKFCYHGQQNMKRYIRFDHDLHSLLPLAFQEPVNDIPGHFRCQPIQAKEPVVIWKCPCSTNL